jgi:hypothetical protein
MKYGSCFLQVIKCMFADCMKTYNYFHMAHIFWLIDVKGITTTVLVDLFVVRM